MGRARSAVYVVATFGALLGHALGYLFAHPDAHARAHALAAHGYMGVAAALALPAFAAAIAWILVAPRGDRRSVRPASVAAVQVAVFVGQEILERAVVGHGPAAAVAEPALWWGVVAQVAVGLALGAVLRQAEGAVDRLRLGSVPVPPTASRDAAPRCPAGEVPPPPRPSPLSRRGPPLPRVT